MASLEGQRLQRFPYKVVTARPINWRTTLARTSCSILYPKDDTPGCTKEACGFRDSIQSVTQANAVVLGVSRDNVESHNQFISKSGRRLRSYPILRWTL